MRRRLLVVLVVFSFALAPAGIVGCYHGDDGGDRSPPADDGGNGGGNENGDDGY